MIVAILCVVLAAQDSEPQVTIARPADGSVDVVVEAWQVFGPYRVRWTGAEVRVELDGVEPFTVVADERGRVRMPLHKVRMLAKGAIAIRVRAGAATASLAMSRAECDGIVRDAADRRRAAMRTDATEETALAVLDLVPGDLEALLALARAREKQGDVLRAILAYREHLLAGGDDVKRHIAALAARLKKPMPVPRAAIDFAKASIELAREGKYREAADACRAAQRVAPWWPEAYRRAALLEAAAWLAVKCEGDISMEDFETYAAFDADLRELHVALKSLKESAASLKDRWDEARKLMETHKELLKGIFAEAGRK